MSRSGPPDFLFTCDSGISSKQLLNHCEKLLVNEEDDDSKIAQGKIEKSDISQNEDYILDAPFTCKEIHFVIVLMRYPSHKYCFSFDIH
jgi:hypothetical protein